ncbi:TetR/AcrR family transcriptional regulator [Streptomyces sp. NPDC005498]|uniref:TetR/AcrR family transcriptional regulator n=1 Tax=Streptomyces sp. NPDC005498 TaxID=3364717 RepID=UPI0036B745BD
MTEASATTRTVRRPRDRKEQILRTAAECFRRTGYHATSMEQIAAAVGITAGALYRHFDGKQELLGQALLSGLDPLLRRIETAQSVDDLIRTTAALVLDGRTHTVLWEREIRNLTEQHRQEVRHKHEAAATGFGAAIARERPELTAVEGELLAWAVLGVLTSPSYHGAQLPRARFEELLGQLASAVVWLAPFRTARPSRRPANQSRPGLLPVSRREALLAAAIPLFVERGFQAVSMEDIGAAAGISRPTVYNHFSSKAELLTAALHRETEAAWHVLSWAIVRSSTPAQALTEMVRCYADSAVRRHGITGLLVSELPQLPADRQRFFRRNQVEYVDEWTALLRSCRPELGGAETRITIQAVFTLVNTVSRRPALEACPDPAEVLIALGVAVLGTGHRP